MEEALRICVVWNPNFGLYQTYQIFPHFAFSVVVFAWNTGYAAFAGYPFFRLILDKSDGFISKGCVLAPCWLGIIPPLFVWGMYLLPSITVPYIIALMYAVSQGQEIQDSQAEEPQDSPLSVAFAMETQEHDQSQPGTAEIV